MQILIPGSLSVGTFIPATQRDHGSPSHRHGTVTCVQKSFLSKAECMAQG